VPFIAVFEGFNNLPRTAAEGKMVPRRGLEPPRPCERQHLKLVRLPIPPSGHGSERQVSRSPGRMAPIRHGLARVNRGFAFARKPLNRRARVWQGARGLEMEPDA
jgi:hypothetical protein